jgi:DNA sulfur modification protein DndB
MKLEPLALPALRGAVGDWIYYACLMPLTEIARRVQFADEIHPNKALSELIQRSLEGPRSRHIAEYLTTKERFFNSLVLATYGGSPDWLEVGNFKSADKAAILKLVPEPSRDALGFLSLTGSEKIFAIDGQHRLAGIRRAIAEGTDLSQEQAPVILVGHKKDAPGMQRTRRLFTTLNKTAVPVRKRDIIALDEDDVMAIISRRLVETNASFKDPKIAVIGSQNIPVANRVSLTTISSLYDTLKLLFMFDLGQRTDRSLRFNRPSDERLDHFYEVATGYFEALATTFKPVGQLLSAADPCAVTQKHRGPQGGHLLFRPIGLEIVTRVAIEIARNKGTDAATAVMSLGKIPTDLAKPPYADVIWDTARQVINVKAKGLAREILRLICGLPVDLAKLEDDFALEPDAFSEVLTSIQGMKLA